MRLCNNNFLSKKNKTKNKINNDLINRFEEYLLYIKTFTPDVLYKYIFIYFTYIFFKLLPLKFLQSKWFNSKMRNYHNKVQIFYCGKWCKCHCSKIDTCSFCQLATGTVKGIKRDKKWTKGGWCRYVRPILGHLHVRPWTAF